MKVFSIQLWFRRLLFDIIVPRSKLVHVESRYHRIGRTSQLENKTLLDFLFIFGLFGFDFGTKVERSFLVLSNENNQNYEEK